MVETNIVLSINSTYRTASCILCHLPAFQSDSKQFPRVSVIRVSTAERNPRPNTVAAMPEARKGINPLKSSLVFQFLHRIKVEMYTYPARAILTQLKPWFHWGYYKWISSVTLESAQFASVVVCISSFPTQH